MLIEELKDTKVNKNDHGKLLKNRDLKLNIRKCQNYWSLNNEGLRNNRSRHAITTARNKKSRNLNYWVHGSRKRKRKHVQRKENHKESRYRTRREVEHRRRNNLIRYVPGPNRKY